MSGLFFVCFSLALAYPIIVWLRRRRRLSSFEQLRGVLAPHGLVLEAHLHRRASANTRLARTFQLSNTFVSADRCTHKTFVDDARSLLRRWDTASFPDTARAILDAHAHMLPPTLPFDSFVQLVTFSLIVETLIGGRVSADEWRQVLVVTDGINSLWEASKRHPAPREEDRILRVHMDAHLRRWLPHLEQPLDFVIPAYETMWGVVKRCFVEVKLRGASNSAAWAFYPRKIPRRP